MGAVVLGALAALFLAPELFGLDQMPPFTLVVAFRPAAAVGLLVFADLRCWCGGGGGRWR